MIEVYRYLISFTAWLILIRMCAFMYWYYRKVYVIRKHLETHEWQRVLVLVPPVFWTLMYHLAVSLLVFVLGLTTLYSVTHGFPFNPVHVLTLPTELFLFVVLDRFTYHYRIVLETGLRDLE